MVNRLITVREVAEGLNISIGSCHSIFTNNLDAAKFVPKFLNFDQKQHQIFGQKQHTSNAAATAPRDFFLFPKLKRPMKGRRYGTIEEIKMALKEELNKITNIIIFLSASRIGKIVGTSV